MLPPLALRAQCAPDCRRMRAGALGKGNALYRLGRRSLSTDAGFMVNSQTLPGGLTGWLCDSFGMG